MDYLELAKEFAKKIAQDERVLALRAAKEANDNDAELQKLIGEFNILRLDLNREAGKPDRDEAKCVDLDKQLQQLYTQIMSNQNMHAFDEARASIDTMMNTINQALSVAINGGDVDSVEEVSGCGCGCEDCDGDCDCGCEDEGCDCGHEHHHHH